LADKLLDGLSRSGGGIVPLHDVQDQSAMAMPLLFHGLTKKGYRVVHLRWE
jgi:peptidoglycan-N-acetylglucosamine deacetylase